MTKKKRYSKINPILTQFNRSEYLPKLTKVFFAQCKKIKTTVIADLNLRYKNSLCYINLCDLLQFIY
jgi:hypothetical protein